MRNKYKVLIVLFVLVYGVFIIKLDLYFDEFSELIVASAFFFTLFAGFFMGRQSDRYTQINDEISSRDGIFSTFYRLSGIIPNLQDKTRKVITNHYQQISDSGKWSYHLFNPSTTLTDLTQAMHETSADVDGDTQVEVLGVLYGSIGELQQKRKKLISLFGQKMLMFQWVVIYIPASLLLFSFNFIPSNNLVADIFIIVFGLAVFLVLILLKQLNDLSIFGKQFTKQSANDMIRILEEKDKEEV